MSLDTIKAMVSLGFRMGFQITVKLSIDDSPEPLPEYYNCDMVENVYGSNIRIKCSSQWMFDEVKAMIDRRRRHHQEYSRYSNFCAGKGILVYTKSMFGPSTLNYDD